MDISQLQKRNAGLQLALFTACLVGGAVLCVLGFALVKLGAAYENNVPRDAGIVVIAVAILVMVGTVVVDFISCKRLNEADTAALLEKQQLAREAAERHAQGVVNFEEFMAALGNQVRQQLSGEGSLLIGKAVTLESATTQFTIPDLDGRDRAVSTLTVVMMEKQPVAAPSEPIDGRDG